MPFGPGHWHFDELRFLDFTLPTIQQPQAASDVPPRPRPHVTRTWPHFDSEAFRRLEPGPWVVLDRPPGTSPIPVQVQVPPIPDLAGKRPGEGNPRFPIRPVFGNRESGNPPFPDSNSAGTGNRGPDLPQIGNLKLGLQGPKFEGPGARRPGPLTQRRLRLGLGVAQVQVVPVQAANGWRLRPGAGGRWPGVATRGRWAR